MNIADVDIENLSKELGEICLKYLPKRKAEALERELSQAIHNRIMRK